MLSQADSFAPRCLSVDHVDMASEVLLAPLVAGPSCGSTGAADRTPQELVEVFIEHGAEVNMLAVSALARAADRTTQDLVEVFIEHGTEIRLGRPVPVPAAG